MGKSFKWIFSLFLVYIFCMPVHGQVDEQPGVQEAVASYDKAIRTSLSSWLDARISNARLGFEYRITEKAYLRHGLGYYFKLGFREEPSGLLDMNGFSLHTAYRWLTPRRNSFNDNDMPYFEVSLMYRYLDIDVAGDFTRASGNFSQRINYTIWENSYGWSATAGQLFYIGKRLRLDLYIGIGILLVRQKFSAIPEGALFRTNGGSTVWDYEPGETTTEARPILPVGLSFMYVLE